MLNKNIKKGDRIFAIIGEKVEECLFEHFGDIEKFVKITIISTKKSVFKQQAYCYNKEKHALIALRDKLEKALDEVCFKLSQLL